MESKEIFYYDLIRKGDLEELKRAFLEDRDACTVFPYEKSLVITAIVKGQLKILEFLISQGCDLNTGDKERNVRPLQAAVLSGQLEMASMLLDLKVDIEAEDDYGNTALMEAVFESNEDLEMIRLLIAHGADPSHVNHAGVSPESLAENTGKKEILQLFKDQ